VDEARDRFESVGFFVDVYPGYDRSYEVTSTAALGLDATALSDVPPVFGVDQIVERTS